MSIKAVLFDLDGTLLDRDASVASFVRYQYDRYTQLQAVEKDVYVQRFIGLDNHGLVWKDKVYRQLIDEFSIRGLKWTELLSDYVNNFHRYCVGFPKLKRMISELKSCGIKLALVSNGYGQFQYDNFKALGVHHLFDAVLISEWEGIRKPDPEIFTRALFKLGVEAEEAVFVGDHPENDVRASRNIGMKAIWKRNEHVPADVEADAIMDDLEDLIRFVLPGRFGNLRNLPSGPSNCAMSP